MRRSCHRPARSARRTPHMATAAGRDWPAAPWFRPSGPADERGERCPVTAPERGDAQGVGDPHATTDQRGNGAEQQLVPGGESVDRRGHEQRHDRPQAPDRKGDVVARHCAEQIATRDGVVAAFPAAVSSGFHSVMRWLRPITSLALTFRRGVTRNLFRCSHHRQKAVNSIWPLSAEN